MAVKYFLSNEQIFLSGLRGYPRAAVHPQQLLAGGGGGDEGLLQPAGDRVNYDETVSCHVIVEHPQVGESLPQEMWHQLHQLERRISLFEDDVESEE